MNKSRTVPILFHGGTYGTYLEWCLTTLRSSADIQPPFTSKGNSHGYQGNHLLNMDGWQRYLVDDRQLEIVRFHPKTLQTESLESNLNSVLQCVDRAIYIYPDSDSILLCVNNAYNKIWKDWWGHAFQQDINQNVIYDNWPVPTTVPIDEVPAWIKREFLSLYFMPSWESQVEWNHIKTWSNSNCYTVLTKDLLHNFEETISRIMKFCQFDFKRSISELVPYHLQNLKLQKFIGQDQLCNNILQKVLSNEYYEWQSLPLLSEAWIQWQLRNLGYEIRCHGLDIFPTNSVQLKELLYPV